MTDPQQLLQQFIAADHDSGGGGDPLPYLEQLTGGDRTELEALIDAYLAQAPRRPFDPAAFASSPARDAAQSLWQSMSGASGRWPTVLPALRHRAQITRAQLVHSLAERLGAAGREDKVAAYYHAMEQGTLPSRGVHDRVLDALGAIVGEHAAQLRQLGRAAMPAPPASPGTVFARMAEPEPHYLEAAASPAPAGPGSDGRDDIDELFTGASAH